MIESIANLVQLAISGICAGISLYRTVFSRSKAWLLLTLFYIAFFLGDLYWQLYLFFYHITPRYSYVCEPAWYSAYLFLFLLLLEIRDEEQKCVHYRLPWMVLVPVTGLCFFYMQKGDYLSNLVSSVFMGLLLWHSLYGLQFLHSRKREGLNDRFLYFTVILFCLVEYAMWTMSMFQEESTVWNPYVWFDLLLSLTMMLFLPALRKAKAL